MTATIMPTMAPLRSRAALLLRRALVLLALFVAVGVQTARADDADVTLDAIVNDPAALSPAMPKAI